MTSTEGFDAARARFEDLLGFLEGPGARSLEHHDLERRIAEDGREVMRLLYQGHLDMRAAEEVRLDGVCDAQGAAHGAIEEGHARALKTVFGDVRVERMAYRRRGAQNLHPADAAQ